MNNRDNIFDELKDGFQTAFWDSSYRSNLAYRPEFLSNDHLKGRKVLVSLEQELANCHEFMISVAFITKSGITPLLQTLLELEHKGIPGKILTTDYLSFSEPEALEKLAGLKNIELRMFRTDEDSGGFHTKGYIFREDEIYRIIIGSSNMTLSAITKNREWNTRFISAEEGEIAQAVLGEFEDLWNDSHTIDYDTFIDQYRLEYLQQKMIRQQRRQAMEEQVVEIDRCKLVPNKMQVAFFHNLLELRKQDMDKALLLSSTGASFIILTGRKAA